MSSRQKAREAEPYAAEIADDEYASLTDVKVYWTCERRWFHGAVTGESLEEGSGRRLHRVRYCDGSELWHHLASECWLRVTPKQTRRKAIRAKPDSKASRALPTPSRATYSKSASSKANPKLTAATSAHTSSYSPPPAGSWGETFVSSVPRSWAIEDAAAGSNYALLQGSAMQLLPLLPDGCVDLIVVDPPAGMYGRHWEWDKPWSDGEWAALLPQVWRVLSTGGRFIMFGCGKDSFTDHLRSVTRKHSGIALAKDECVWLHSDRRNQQNPQSPFRSHEVILVWRRAHGESCEQHLGSLRGADSFSVPKDPSGGSFKPLPLMRQLVREFETNGHGVVCDFCMGQAGVCGVAALEEGRQFIGVEIAADRFRSSAELISAASGDGISAEETHRLRQVGRRRREREGKERLERSQKRYAGEKERRRADEEAACCGDSFRAWMRVAEAGRNR